MQGWFSFPCIRGYFFGKEGKQNILKYLDLELVLINDQTLGSLYPLWYSFIRYFLLMASSVNIPLVTSQFNLFPLR